MSLTVGLLGYGPEADRHLAALVESQEVGTVVLGEPEESRRQAALNRWGIIKHAHEEYEGPLEDPSVEVVDILAPPAMRPELVRAALARGKHVIVASPPASTPAEMDELMAAAASSGRRLLCCLDGLWAPYVKQVERLLKAGEIGKPLVAGAELEAGEETCDLLEALGYRAVYLLEHFLGPITWVSCRMSKATVEGDDSAEAGAEGSVQAGRTQAAAIACEMASGVVAAVTLAACPEPEEPIGPGREALSVHLRGAAGELLLRDNPEDESPLLADAGQGYVAERVLCPLDFRAWSTSRMVDHFIAGVLKEATPDETAVQARSALLVLEALRAAAVSGGALFIERDLATGESGADESAEQIPTPESSE